MPFKSIKYLAVCVAAAALSACGGSSSSSSSTNQIDYAPTLYANAGYYSGDNWVAAYSLSDTGTLTEQASSPYAIADTGTGYNGEAASIKVNEKTARLFATSYETVAVFDINPDDGTLTAVEGSPFSSGGERSTSIVVNEAGTRIFVANPNTDNISVMDVASDGTLTAVEGSPFDATDSGFLDHLQLMNDESLLVATDEDAQIYVYNINAETGVLTEVDDSPFDTNEWFWSNGVSPDGTLLYVQNAWDGDIQVFSFDESTGAAEEIDGSPFTVDTDGGYLRGYTFSPDGEFMYVGDDNAILYVFSVDANGGLTLLDDMEITDMTYITDMAISSDGEYLIAVDEEDQLISAFSLDEDGLPTLLDGYPMESTNLGSVSGIVIAD